MIIDCKKNWNFKTLFEFGFAEQGHKTNNLLVKSSLE